MRQPSLATNGACQLKPVSGNRGAGGICRRRLNEIGVSPSAAAGEAAAFCRLA